MKKTLSIMPLIIITVILIACAAPVETPRPSPVAPPAEQPAALPEERPETVPTPAEPVMIKEWTGRGIKTTEPFAIDKKPWVIAWAHDPMVVNGQSMGIFQIYVMSTGSNIPVAVAANSMEKDSDSSYVYETGMFYLEINAANTAWRVQVHAIE